MGNCVKDIVKESWEYSDGKVIWKRKPKSQASKGDVVAYVTKPSGHMVLSITEKGGKRTRKLQYARVVWLLVHGDWPEGEIDHIDCDPQNNSIDNLRVVNRAENNWNKFRSPDYAVLKHGATWRVRLKKNGKKYVASLFKTKEEAIEFRDLLVDELFDDIRPKIEPYREAA